MNDATKLATMSVLRSILIAAGGYAVAKGWVAESNVEQTVGTVLVFVTAVWGVIDKYLAERKAAEREAVAVNAGIAAANASPTNIPPVHPVDVPAVIAEFSPPKETK